MGFFDFLKRKPGGTTVGNFIRKVAGEETKGALGNGAMTISQKDYDKKNLSDFAYLQKYNETKAQSSPTASVYDQVKATFDTGYEKAEKGMVATWLGNNVKLVVIAGLGILVLIYMAFFKKKRFGR